jgi:hypothetical protein
MPVYEFVGELNGRLKAETGTFWGMPGPGTWPR